MNTGKILLITIALLSCALSERISVPLKLNNNNQLYLTANVGSSAQCQVDFLLSINTCNSSIQKSAKELEQCGVEFVGLNPYFKGLNYQSKIQLGSQQKVLNFTAPNGSKSQFYGESVLCLGFQRFDFELNTLLQLYQTKQISDQKFFITLNNLANSQTGQVIGQIDFGAPDTSITTSQFVNIKNVFNIISFDALSRDYFTYGSAKIYTQTSVYFNLDSPFSGIPNNSFQLLLNILMQQGISYELDSQLNTLYVKSIEQLQDITIQLVQSDSKTFLLTLKPTEYTRKTADGKFQVLIYPVFSQQQSFYLGYTALQSYYIGFDLQSQSISIAQINNNQV
ncbi:hypothetical protein TTHERM_00465010 (macronuclear) [Tetrahymena thermophila SB210]|uniref:Peptidase A1 domain-containing protein n=1 Tax=Tetrahymena thermophila (strain SB210) TaxID=312017 RepID=I7MAK2_TETTS|nr:hypothetical protein TTHERM_00465010 [Tetrahymena thermophila SB210]EAS04753.1 hypothetical protein TTHERM_00465010 [Tetrahymena thermophila SB210]|eukprot:XP_001024998.1 hypothetical protein TTHERM_00465010 [Tetrahymena thermophila SB210]